MGNPGQFTMKFFLSFPLIFSVAAASVSRLAKDMESAVDANNVRNARKVLKKGFSVDAPITNEGVTALMIAAEMGKTKMINFLATEAGASMQKVDKQGYNPLHFTAGFSGSVEGLRACLAISTGSINARETDQGNTPLHFAAANGSLEKVTLLVEAGADLEIKNNIGNTPIIAACYRDNVEVVQYLLNRGADFLEVNDQDQDCLAIAANFDSLRVARILLDRINPTKRNTNTGIIRALTHYAHSQEMKALLSEYFPGTISFISCPRV